ncbi:MAG: ABC transporter substrate-binding protein [Thermomicrobiales bacterium]|nr:ABC transporter substrate-binding protein [Thermomicrobiales bacterium]
MPDRCRDAAADPTAAVVAPPDAGLSRRRLIGRAAALGLALPAAQALRAAPTHAAPPAQTDPATLTIAMNGSPSDLDPQSADDYRSIVAIRGVYEQLIDLAEGSTEEYVGSIAEAWTANDDASVWTFTLRDGVTFQDGSPCDAEAVRASFERLITLGYAPGSEMGRFLSDPAQVSAPDPRTVVFDLGRPQPLFEAGIGSVYGGQIVNANVARAHEEDGDWGNTWAHTNTAGMGTGPYQITAFEPGQQAVFARNEAYWRGWEGDHFDRIVIRVVEETATRRQLIERGEVDIVDSLTPEALQALEQNPELTVDKHYSMTVDYFILTVAGPLASPQARQAMCYAFPYDEVVAGVYKGYAKRAVGAVAELCRGFDPDTFVYPTDLDKAKALFAEAGVADGTRLTLVQEAGDENVKTAAQLFQANLAQIGIDLNIETVDLQSFTDLIFSDAPAEERPNVLPWFWSPVYNDAWDHLLLQISCDAWGSQGTNSGYYCNERVQELMDRAKDELDPTAYQTDLSEIQQIISRDDPPAIYTVQREWTTVLRHNVAGFVFNPLYFGAYDFYRLHRTA